MFKKRLIVLLIIFTLVISLVGCDKPNKQTEPTDDSRETTSVTENTEVVGPTLAPIIESESDLWSNEYREITINTVKLTKDWSDYITIGETVINSTTPADMSTIPNYFYGENSSSSRLESGYYVPTYQLLIATDDVDFGNYTKGSLSITSTTLNDEDATKLVLDRVLFTANVHLYEVDLESGRDDLERKDGEFGLWDSYKAVNGIVGEPYETKTEKMDDIEMIICSYSTDEVNLKLTFMKMKSDDIDNAILTSIDWVPSLVRDMLYAQENIVQFEGHPMWDYVENTEDVFETESETEDEIEADVDAESSENGEGQ